MAIVSSKLRCADCGSTKVTLKNGVFSCIACGVAQDHAMPESDLAKISRINLTGISKEELVELRSKYRNLEITTWTNQTKLQK